MAERLRRSNDVRAVLAHGRAAHGRHAVVRAARRDGRGGPCRWTVSASRKVGSAVDRNRAKRRLRAVLRELALPAGVDVVVIARASAATCDFGLLFEEVSALVAQVDGPEAAEVHG